MIYSLSSFVLGGIQTIFNHPWCVSYINNSYKIFVIIISSLKYKQKQLSMEQILEFSFYRFSFLQKRCIFMNSCCRYVHSCIRGLEWNKRWREQYLWVEKFCCLPYHQFCFFPMWRLRSLSQKWCGIWKQHSHSYTHEKTE